MTPRVRILTLVREELRSLPRNMFGLAAIAVLFSVFAPIAAFAYSEGPTAVRDTLIFTWLVGELVVAIVVAARVAAARRSRFVDSLYTTPLEQRTWFAAQAIVGGVLALLLLAAQLPFILVHVAWLGIPVGLPAVIVGAAFMAAFAVALGLFCGVVVGDSGAGAAAGLAGGIAFLSFVIFIFHGIAVTSPPNPMTPTILRLTSLSPLALVIDGAGIGLFDMAPVDPWRPIVGLVGIIVGLAGAAWLSYVGAQGPLGWESRGRGRRVIVVALVALAIVTPVASAETSFTEEPNEDPFGFSAGEYTQVAFVPRGAPIHDESFTLSAILQSPDLPLDVPVELDAIVLLLAPGGASARGVHIEVEGSKNVRVESGGSLSVPDGRTSERARQGEGWDSVSEGPARPAFRVPVTLRVVSVDSLSDSPAVVEVHTTFVADGKSLGSHATTTLDGEIRGATMQIMLAGVPFPLAALATIVTRKLRTR